jgi:deoxyribodipyrimidine photo-lyase
MALNFPTAYTAIINRIENINPIKYANTRNYITGEVTYLSPYISRGVISIAQIAKHVLQQHEAYKIEKFLQELAWRLYWQSVWQNKGNAIFTDIKQPQTNVAHHQMVAAINNATTGIDTIDTHINLLYETGYMHNHVRMYISSLACNIANAHWLQPAQWMYYHLLDGDIASNTLSWQWTAGTFSSKKYYCNQENINKYTNSNQLQTYLDTSYDALQTLPIPTILQAQTNFIASTSLPKTTLPIIEKGLPILVYNSYNLDPLWHSGLQANRILLLEPSHFLQYPVSEKVLQFIINLSKNIQGIQIFTGEFFDLQKNFTNEIIYKAHPTNTHYTGNAENNDGILKNLTGYYPSFFNFWKKCKPYLINQ